MKMFFKKLGRVLFLLGVPYVAIVAYFYWQQETLIFPGQYMSFSEKKTAWVEKVHSERLWLNMPDGTTLSGALVQETNKPKEKLVIFHGGNGQNVVEVMYSIGKPLVKNADLLAFNYRGYGRSEGEPSEASILEDALYIAKMSKGSYKEVYLVGISLGSSVASYVASKLHVNGLVLLVPFDSIANMAWGKYPFLPVSAMLKHPFETAKFLTGNVTPKALISASNDDIVPKSRLEALLPTLRNLKFRKELGGGHSDVLWNRSFPQTFLNALKSVGL